MGDYGDLRELLVDAAGSGADFMLINPVHASAPVSPIEPSPYSPMSRRFINTTYIRPQDIAEFAELDEQDAAAVRALHEQVAPMNTESSPMDLDAAWKAKRAALQIIFRQPRSPERQASFEAFKEKAGRRPRHLGTVERRIRSARGAMGAGLLVPHDRQKQSAHPGAANRASRSV